MGGGAPNPVAVTAGAAEQTVPGAIAPAQSRIIQIAFSPAGTTLPPPEYVPSTQAFPPNTDCPAITFVAPQTQTSRTAVVLFARFLDFQHVPEARPEPATVVFKNNVPEGDALGKLIAGMTPGQPVNGVTLGVLTPPPDAEAAKRIDAIVDALAAAGHPTASLRKISGVLSQQDRVLLTNARINLDGKDEVIFLER